MGRKRKEQKGITDWPAKRVVIHIVLGHESIRSVATAVCPGGEGDDVTESVVTSFPTWGNSDPEGEAGQVFFKLLPEKMHFTVPVTTLQIVRSSISEFLDFLNPADRAQVVADPKFRTLTTEKVSPTAGDTSQHRMFEYTVDTFAYEESIRDGLRSGRIDQKYHYQSQETALRWLEVINAEDYSSFDDCKAALKSILQDHWPEDIPLNRISSVVTLGGGGAASKDKVLLNALVDARNNADNKLYYSIIDISQYMINSTMPAIAKHLAAKGWANRVEIKPIVGDVLLLGDYRADLPVGSERALYVLTGGTLGNLNEKHFFEALDRAAKPNDLLLLGADTFDCDRLEDEKAKLRSKYAHPKMKAFFLPAFQAALCAMNMPFHPKTQLSAMNVGISEGHTDGHSSVANSLSPYLWFSAGNNRPITLVSSTRYDREALTQFAQQFGWSLLRSVSSPTNPSYFQFLFERS